MPASPDLSLAASPPPAERRRFRPQQRTVVVTPGYSRMVGTLKWLLPVAAVALLAMVFLWSALKPKNVATITLDLAGGTTLSKSGELTMVKPRFFGVDAQKRPFVVTAVSATQDRDDKNRIGMESLQAEMTMRDGRWLTVMAPAGLFDRTAATLRLEGPVDFYSDDGFEFHAVHADIDLQAGSALSRAPVHGQAPFGDISAEGLEISESGQVLRFFDGVRLLVRPDDLGRVE